MGRGALMHCFGAPRIRLCHDSVYSRVNSRVSRGRCMFDCTQNTNKLIRILGETCLPGPERCDPVICGFPAARRICPSIVIPLGYAISCAFLKAILRPATGAAENEAMTRACLLVTYQQRESEKFQPLDCAGLEDMPHSLQFREIRRRLKTISFHSAPIDSGKPLIQPEFDFFNPIPRFLYQ